ncbi:MAG TPA: sulfotransferase domain-containing protein [Candidatus Aquilonibacter sp.]|jgi:hypothetical protein|nr:sulfotransferase domain-containing protein [Candidatus Aquilonibacter sp.]
MTARLTAAIYRTFGLNRPGRELVIFDDDVFLVSFPKSGNTWTRFLVANLVYPDQRADFGNIHDLVPDPGATTKRRLHNMPRPRIIKSHECFDPRYPRVIYIVRDPRDVAVSQYHYHRKCKRIDDDYPMAKFIARFLAGETCPHGSWGENVATWLVTRSQDHRFLLLRYEDMLSDTPRELAKIASFLNLAVTPQHISQAIERSSPSEMRRMEKSQSELSRLTRDTRKDLSFVRAASSGGWKSELPDVLASKIETAWAPLMQRLGYELTTVRPDERIEPAGGENNFALQFDLSRK